MFDASGLTLAIVIVMVFLFFVALLSSNILLRRRVEELANAGGTGPCARQS